MRKKIEFQTTFGRDAGKTFIIEEAPADQAEWWAIRCFLSIGKSGIDIPDDIASQGVGGLIAYGIKALFKLNPYDAKPLLEEMMECVKLKTSSGAIRGLVQDDIEEVKSRFELRKQVIDLHTGFFSDDDQSTSESEAQYQDNSSAMRIPRKQ